MTRKGRRLVEDFLLPSLNEGKYGDLLKWVDQMKGHFSIRWSHKNAAKWSLTDTLVFQDWDRLKGRFKPDQKGYYMQAKQRFRAALYKLSTVEQLPSPDKHIKHYQLCLNKKNEIIHKRMQKMVHKSENSGIPTPVICKNTLGRGTELVGRDYLEESSSNSSSSPLSIKSEDCSTVQEPIVYEERDYQEYQNALKRQRKQSSPNFCPQEVVKREIIEAPQTFILRDSPQINIVRKASHVLSQVVPVYNKNISRQTAENCMKPEEENSTSHQSSWNGLRKQMENTQMLVQSPGIFFVPTYNNQEKSADTRKSTVINVELEPKELEVARYLASQYRLASSINLDALKSTKKNDDTKKFDGALNDALNLSVKCDTSVLCR